MAFLLNPLATTRYTGGRTPSKGNGATCNTNAVSTPASVCREGKLTSYVVGPLAALTNEDNPKQIACYLQDGRVKWTLQT